MRRLRIKPSGWIIFVIMVCLALLSGCGGRKLSDDFDENEVKKQVENVITFINKQDSESLIEMCNVQMKEALTDDVLKQIYEAIGEGGQYEGIEDMSITGLTDKTSQEEFAVVVARAKYETRTFTFTITFTKQMKLAGLYYR